MKQFNENQFDEMFREKIGNYSELPPESVLFDLKKNFSSHKPGFGSQFLKLGIWIAIPVIIAVTGVFISIGNSTQISNQKKNIVNNEIQTVNNDIIASNTIEEESQSVSNQKNEPIQKVKYTNPTVISPLIKSESIIIPNEDNSIEKTSEITDNQNSNTVLTTPKEKTNEIEVTVNVVHSTCRKPNGEIYLRANNGERYNYSWLQFENQESISYKKNLYSGTYQIEVSDNQGNNKTIEVIVNDFGTVNTLFTHYELSKTVGMPIYFENKSTIDGKPWNDNVVTHMWYFGDGNTSTQPEPNYSYKNIGNYTVSLVVKSDKGCKDSLALNSIFISNPEMETPNVFSPNNDGTNDVFKPETYGFIKMKCSIYTRSGDKVSEWTDVNGYWDGKINNSDKTASPGVYYYIIQATGADGKNINKKGFIQLFL